MKRRVVPHREEDGERGDGREGDERRDRSEDLPARVGGEERREEDREARRVQRVRRHGVTARGLELARDEERAPAAMPIAIWTGAESQPWSIE